MKSHSSLGVILLNFKSSFLSTKYTSLGANLPPNSFSETAPRSSIPSIKHTSFGAVLPPESFCEMVPRIPQKFHGTQAPYYCSE